ncbi:MAG: HINT domain-containing protein, partial [Pirellula sp.]|nr:HINT domain-containing protein [Pirellula sp.]
MKLTKSKYSIPAQSNTRARVRIASWLWLGILNCLALVTWHQSTEPKALSNSLSGPAWVRDIEPCQGVLPGDGHVITATFLHSSGDVIDLVWSDDESRNLESVGTTSNHPFYSFDRGDYVQAGSLQEGERLLTYSGDTKRVVSKL